MKLLLLIVISSIILEAYAAPANVLRRYSEHIPRTNGKIISTRRALIDADIDPLIAALIVESMHHHHPTNVNRRQNAVPQNGIYRNKIMTVNKISKNVLEAK